jgi:hypothetical protein
MVKARMQEDLLALLLRGCFTPSPPGKIVPGEKNPEKKNP